MSICYNSQGETPLLLFLSRFVCVLFVLIGRRSCVCTVDDVTVHFSPATVLFSLTPDQFTTKINENCVK